MISPNTQRPEPGKSDMPTSESAHTVDVSILFSRVRSQQVLLSYDEHTYEFSPELKDNWLYVALQGFLKLRGRLQEEGKHAKRIATIGTGAGADALLLADIFHPDLLVATDIHPGTVVLAEKNIRSNLNDREMTVNCLTGDLGAPLREEGIGALDLVYMNLPLLPEDTEIVFKGMKSSTFVSREKFAAAPEEVRRNRLAMYYVALRDLAPSIAPDGNVLINLGTRMSSDEVRAMIADAGYHYQGTLFSMLKKQSQPEAVLPAFAAAEAEGKITFDFYRFAEAQKLLESVEEGSCSGEELKALLLPCRVSASEALARFTAGEDIGHIAELVWVKKK